MKLLWADAPPRRLPVRHVICAANMPIKSNGYSQFAWLDFDYLQICIHDYIIIERTVTEIISENRIDSNESLYLYQFFFYFSIWSSAQNHLSIQANDGDIILAHS